MRTINETLTFLQIGSDTDWEEQWEAIQEIQHFLDDKKESLEGIAGETLYPTAVDIPTETLAAKIAEYCEELYERRKEALSRDLSAANAIYPDVRKALVAADMNVPLCSMVMNSPGNPSRPSLYLNNNRAPLEVRKKADAIESAQKYGALGWWTVPEYIQWLHGSGPIFEKAMAKYGYSPHKGVTGRFS